jgi:hypothetical protein
VKIYIYVSGTLSISFQREDGSARDWEISGGAPFESWDVSEGIEGNHGNLIIIAVRAEIRSGYLPNTSLECYRLS